MARRRRRAAQSWARLRVGPPRWFRRRSDAQRLRLGETANCAGRRRWSARRHRPRSDPAHPVWTMARTPACRAARLDDGGQLLGATGGGHRAAETHEHRSGTGGQEVRQCGWRRPVGSMGRPPVAGDLQAGSPVDGTWCDCGRIPVQDGPMRLGAPSAQGSGGRPWAGQGRAGTRPPRHRSRGRSATRLRRRRSRLPTAPADQAPSTVGG